jgi:predicted transcriptional regulator of viral defense system
MGKESTFDLILAKAVDQHGFVRVEDVREMGINPVYLRKLAAAGRLENRFRGLYRLSAYPITANMPYQEAILWAHGVGVIAGESALALWGLADANPKLTDVVVPTGYELKRSGGPKVRVRHARFSDDDVEMVDNIRVFTPVRAIADAIDIGADNGLVRHAIDNARRRDLIGELAEARLRVALADRGTAAVEQR